MSSLPVVIFQFALAPTDWQKLAWTGALIITLAVLTLSIFARALAATRQTGMNTLASRYAVPRSQCSNRYRH